MKTLKSPCRVVAPCENCPFRRDIHPYLTENRAKEIADAIESDLIFHCHKTVDYSRTRPQTKKSAMCAGSMVIMLKNRNPNFPMRMGAALGLLNFDRILTQQAADVTYDDFEDFVAAHKCM